MKPPASCAELARRLKLDAVPLHGRTYHDMRLAADLIEVLTSPLTNADGALEFLLERNPSYYHAEQEPER